MKDKDSDCFHSAKYISIGIHPWFVNLKNIEEQITWMKSTIENDKRVIAIGECGLDKLCDTDPELQIKAFNYCIKISESYKLPLIIHSVKTSDEIIKIKKLIKPKQTWIIHGFRGKVEQAVQYIKNDFCLSYGRHYNVESLKVTPINKMFFETDESTENIKDIILHAATTLDISPEELQNKVSENAKRLFFNR